MGCTTSKQPVCRNCKARCSLSMPRRSYSMHGGGHHPQPDIHHIVGRTSSTLGSLKLDENRHIVDDGKTNGVNCEDFSVGLMDARMWSKMINEKIPKIVPKTPIQTPPGEPEMINAWELMEGLEDTSPYRSPNHFRSFSFHVAANSYRFDFPKSGSRKPVWLELADNESNSNSDKADAAKTKSQKSNLHSPWDSNAPSEVSEVDPDKVCFSRSQKPMWLDKADKESDLNSNATSIITEFDPDMISTFRKALEDLPPENPFHLKQLEGKKQQMVALEAMDVKNVDADFTGKTRVLFYFTSLRGVRTTYEDCCKVRVILKGIGVRVDERDVSMHSGFKEELKELLQDEYNGFLPRVFLGGKYIGGVEEISRMHEDEQLEKVLEGCEMVDDGEGVCEGCGDIRFVLCQTCSGSCKVYYESDFDDDSEFGFQRCPDCNENGIVRCPACDQ